MLPAGVSRIIVIFTQIDFLCLREPYIRVTILYNQRRLRDGGCIVGQAVIKKVCV